MNSPTICALGSMVRPPILMRWPSRKPSASASLMAVWASFSVVVVFGTLMGPPIRCPALSRFSSGPQAAPYNRRAVMIALAECTHLEAARIARDARSVVLFPLGAVEEHGPHLPLLVDWLGAEELARRIAPHLARAGFRPVLAPSLPYGVSTLADDWAGTVSLSRSLVTRLIVEVVRALVRPGFRRFVLVNYQADPGHLRAMAAARNRLGRLRGVRIAFAPPTRPWWIRACTGSSGARGRRPSGIRESSRRRWSLPRVQSSCVARSRGDCRPPGWISAPVLPAAPAASATSTAGPRATSAGLPQPVVRRRSG